MDKVMYCKNQITAKPNPNTHKRAYNNVEDIYLSIFFVSITSTYHTCQKWKDLGIQLKIPKYHLDAIAVDNVNHPSHSQQCCTAMLMKWMELTPDATWSMLQKAINDLPT